MIDTARTTPRVCLVTGGAGFIGVATSMGLTDRFDEVVVLDSMLPQVHASSERPADLASDARLLVGDVCDPAVWDDLLATVKPDVVIHLAAETGTGQSLNESSRHTSVNVVGTSQMLDAFVRNDVFPSRIVLTSSRAVYGEGAWRRNSDGEVFYPGQRTVSALDDAQWDFPNAEPVAMDAAVVQPSPVSVYAVTKLTQEQLIRTWSVSFGVSFSVLRLQNVYGPGQSLSNPYTGIMSLFCRIARTGQSIPLYEDGEVRRDFVLIDDVVSALLATVDLPDGDGLTLDIGSGEMQTIGSAAAAIAEFYGAPAPTVNGKYRQGDVRHAWADVSRAREVLSWAPQFMLKDGVARLATWIEAQPDVPAV